ncbi:MAG: aldehyde ferredoxin oxidoreductase [Candidatus Bathyarchaeota archaeon]|nr:aldehyde ferredoxin oxidoreductase [Candidatus Bathyarchaeota archaeon]
MLGYAGKFLEVNLSSSKIKETSFDDEILKDYVGGRGLAAKILWDRLSNKWERVDSLSSENILLFLTGPLTGYFPGGRICVSGKSPQSNGVVGSTVGGEFGVELRCAGYDGIIVTGASEKPVYLFVKDSDVEIRDASHIWGKDAKRTVTILTKECRELLKKRHPFYGEWKEPSLLYIGPAGENKVRTAVVAAKWSHAAGYGGYGAVMGSKKLKAIAVKGTGPLPDVADIRKVKRLIQVVNNNAYDNDLWRQWGTGSGGYEVGAKTSSEPVRNWQDEWHDEKSFGVDQFENRVWVKQYWSDFGCPTCCLKIAVVKSGKSKGAITDNPDYEMQAYLGPNLGVFTPEENVFLSSLIDDLGLCGIQTGNVLGFAAELFQRGILTKKDLEGIELKWGVAEAFSALIKKIAFREGIGDLLAEGTYRAALKIGKMKNVDVLPYAVQSKGIGIGAHGIRSGKDYPEIISYACSVQGGDHTSTAGLPLDSGGSELMEIFNDSGVYCNFNSFGIPRNLRFDFYEAVTGLKLTREKWCSSKALKILQLQRAMLLLGGPDLKWNPKIHDDNPSRFYEPLPSGPYKGKATDKTAVEEYKNRYYEAVGWDKNGIPKTEVLQKLGLEEVNKTLEKLR